jgi:translation elongation factor P/translation initiation factor 5A
VIVTGRNEGFVKITNVTLIVALLFASGPGKAARAQTSTADQGVDAVEVIKTTATVEKIDLEKRKVTLLLEDGKKKTFKVHKDVQNLDQVKVGDRLKLSYTEEIIILVGKSNEAPAAAAGEEVGVAPKGAKPGMVMVETSALSAKILAVDPAKHRVTLEDPEGKTKTIKLSKKVTNLDQLKPGETVDIVITESLIVEIAK